MSMTNAAQLCTYDACTVKGVAFASPLWSVVRVVGPTVTLQKLSEDMHVEEILNTTLLKQFIAESVSTNEDVGLFINPFLASPPGNEGKKSKVESSDEEVNLSSSCPSASPKRSIAGREEGRGQKSPFD